MACNCCRKSRLHFMGCFPCILANAVNPSALIALLPLFYEKAATLAMVKHGMDIQKKITDHLNSVKFLSWLLISLCLLLLNLYNGNGL